jgi:DNA-binding response OmpR family regulator
MMKELFMKPVLLLAFGDAERCQVNRQFLEEQGYEVITSADGLDCVQKVRKHRPAVVVLDLELRWGGGDGVLALLREEGGALPPVIVTAPDTASGRLLELTGPPVIHFLVHPFPLPLLLDRIRLALTGGPSARQGSAPIFLDSCA